ncbi:MAG: hypothetical protein KY453_06310, partial [Gemmatimonadetes bacterium]|nr:hypothetical protein [Gemmatimonadota bacterium]
GVNAVRQTDLPPVPPDPTSPGIFYAEQVEGAGDGGGPPDGALAGERDGGSRGDDRAPLPATGSGAGLLAIVALAAGAVAARRR